MSNHTGWFASVQVGSDPELFVVNHKGEVRAAKKYVKLIAKDGSTDLGYRLKKGRSGTKAIWDNIAVELQPRPASCTQHHIDSIRNTLLDFMYVLLKPNVRRNYDLSTMPAMPLPDVELGNEVMEFGCSPSFVFTEGGSEVSVPNVQPENCEYRCVGGHVHIGIPKNYKRDPNEDVPGWLTPGKVNVRDEVDALRLTGLLDVFLGTVGCIIEYRMGRQEQAKLRREIIGYGTAGEYRLPDHGYEYRTLSPWWMEHPVYAHLVFNLARDCYHAWIAGDIADKVLGKIDRKRVINAINKCDVIECETILTEGLQVMREWTEDHPTDDKYNINGDADSILYSASVPTDVHLVGFLRSLKPNSHEFWVTDDHKSEFDLLKMHYFDHRNVKAKEDYNCKAREFARKRRRAIRNGEPPPNGGKNPYPNPPTGRYMGVSKKKWNLHSRWFFRSHTWGIKDFMAMRSELSMKDGRDLIAENNQPITSAW